MKISADELFATIGRLVVERDRLAAENDGLRKFIAAGLKDKANGSQPGIITPDEPNADQCHAER